MLRKHALPRLLLALLLLVPCADAKKPPKLKKRPLSARIEEILAQPDVARGFWGMQVVSLKSGKTLYARSADQLFTPASNTKLFTSAAALALIGGYYKFRTTVETAGSIDKYGRLTGDLALVGRGDPNLSGRTLPFNVRTERGPSPVKVLEDLADQLVRKGLKYVDGDVVGDDSWYAFERYGEGWSQDDLAWWWGAPVSALSLNDNVVFVTILPADRPGDKAFIGISPFADSFSIDNRILTTPAGTPRKIEINRQPGSNLVTFWGNIPQDDPGERLSLAIEDPASFAAQIFRQLLEQRGVVIYGRARTRHTELANLSTIRVTAMAPAAGGGGERTPGPSVPQPLVLGQYESQPLVEDLKVTNKVSQNLHAELLLRLLGRERGSSGTVQAGLEALYGFLTQAGVQRQECVLYDGSGLSRQNLVSPAAVVKLLRYAASQPWYQAYRDTLPVSGVDGSLSERFRNSPAHGRLTAKTGSLGHVNALSGYAQTATGDTVVFSIISNNHNLQGRKAVETIDRIVEQIVDDAPAPK